MDQPSEASLNKAARLIESYCKKSGTTTHPEPGVMEAVKLGLANHMDELGRPLCPCRFYPDKAAEIKHRTWICPCEDMRIYKYCHCLLFVREDGQPITEHLPETHEGRQAYGEIRDPTPELGRELKDQAERREQERIDRPS